MPPKKRPGRKPPSYGSPYSSNGKSLKLSNKYDVITFNRNTWTRKSILSYSGRNNHFSSLKDAVRWASYSSRSGNSVQVVTGTGSDGYGKTIKAVYTNGKINKSLTAELKRVYAGSAAKSAVIKSQKDYDTRIEIPKEKRKVKEKYQ